MKVLIPHPDLYHEHPEMRGKPSFGPYLRFIRKKVASPAEGQADFLRYILSKFEEAPELSSSIQQCALLEQHGDLLQLVAATIFPTATASEIEYYSISTPYKFETFYYSAPYGFYFNADENGYVIFPPEVPFEYVQYENLFLAYRMILKKFYQFTITGQERMLYHVTDRITGLKRYSRVALDETFVDVHLTGKLPTFPEDAVCKKTNLILDVEKLTKQLPLSLFEFEGFVIRRIIDVTPQESIAEVKNALLEMQTGSRVKGYEKLKSAVETLIELKNVEVSLTPFLKVNDEYVFSREYTGKSILLDAMPERLNKEDVYRKVAAILGENKKSLFAGNLHARDESLSDFPLLEYLKHTDVSCYLVVPLFDKQELIGMLEVASSSAGILDKAVLSKLEPLYSYFELALKNSILHFHSKIEALVKERFTALQPSVEWKFSEIAWNYLKGKERNEEIEIGTVIFDEVHPIYGAIDIRNSSVERGRSIQEDLLEQLQLIEDTITHLQDNTKLPIMDYLLNILYKNEALKQQVTNVLLAEDEVRINEYLENEVKSLFRHLANSNGKAQESIKYYFKSVDPDNGHLYHHRREFDESLSQINSNIIRYLETEEEKVQSFYPHYFEKYKTDGVEYNIYIGESIAAGKPFDYLYLKNLRLWQLSSMAEIARLTHRMMPSLRVPLQTTQLILVHSNPIAISFRKDERRFDVEGAYNIRYEIMKKRIDKVRIRETGERLTQPGKIAIVYSNKKEATEYEEYIRFLQNKNLLLPEIEQLELEELQGLSGLKAVRVAVNLAD